jgi:hypothetical protein
MHFIEDASWGEYVEKALLTDLFDFVDDGIRETIIENIEGTSVFEFDAEHYVRGKGHPDGPSIPCRQLIHRGGEAFVRIVCDKMKRRGFLWVENSMSSEKKSDKDRKDLDLRESKKLYKSFLALCYEQRVETMINSEKEEAEDGADGEGEGGGRKKEDSVKEKEAAAVAMKTLHRKKIAEGEFEQAKLEESAVATATAATTPASNSQVIEPDDERAAAAAVNIAQKKELKKMKERSNSGNNEVLN